MTAPHATTTTSDTTPLIDATSWVDLADTPATPSAHEHARTVLATARNAALFTTPPGQSPLDDIVCAPLDAASETPVVGDAKPPPNPTASHSDTFAVDASGCAVFALDDAAHAARNLEHSPRASLFAATPRGAGTQGGSSVTLVGSVEVTTLDAEDDAQQEVLASLSAHLGVPIGELAERSWLRLRPSRVHYRDAIYGGEQWLEADGFAAAAPVEIARRLTPLRSKINAESGREVSLFAAHLAGVSADDAEGSSVLSIDQMGFDLAVGRSGTMVRRVTFAMPIGTKEEASSAFNKLFMESHAREKGWL